MKNYIKMIYEATNGSASFKTKIKKNEVIKPYFYTTLFHSIFNLSIPNKKGTIAKKEILDFLHAKDATIDHLLNKDKEKALQLLLDIGGNIFLLKNLSFQLLKTIDKNLIEEKRKKTTSSHSDNDIHEYPTSNTTSMPHHDNSWMLYLDIFDTDFEDDFDTHFSSFDDTLDSFDSEFDAVSCSSCDSNGCSSCGGCGGCTAEKKSSKKISENTSKYNIYNKRK